MGVLSGIGKPWSIVHKEQSAFGDFMLLSQLLESALSASVPMRQNKVSRSRFVQDVVSLLLKLFVSRSGEGSRAGPSVLGRALRSIAQMSIWRVRVQTRMRCLLVEESRADFHEGLATTFGSQGMQIGCNWWRLHKLDPIESVASRLSVGTGGWRLEICSLHVQTLCEVQDMVQC